MQGGTPHEGKVGRLSAHECVFVEEREPNGRLITGPCLTCGRSAFDAVEKLATVRAWATEGAECVSADYQQAMKDCLTLIDAGESA